MIQNSRKCSAYNYYFVIKYTYVSEKAMALHSSTLARKSHGWRSLVGCSTWAHYESDTAEWLHFHFSLSCTGEGNGNRLQCSCLENTRDRGAWWAAIYGVTQSWTRLKRLSNSSSIHMYVQIGIHRVWSGRVLSARVSVQVESESASFPGSQYVH